MGLSLLKETTKRAQHHHNIMLMDGVRGEVGSTRDEYKLRDGYLKDVTENTAAPSYSRKYPVTVPVTIVIERPTEKKQHKQRHT